jgi:sigma-B regulation protein RsbU (phosphoserine phosphatase)
MRAAAARPAMSDSVLSTETPAPGTRGHVLVADDQPDVLRAAGLLLKINGYAVTTATSPLAVERALAGRAGEFDLLLMDLNYARDTTSGQEGLELVARVHELDPDLPIVVMTAWSTVSLAVALMREGALDFVEKPWDNRRLLAAIDAQMAAGRQRRRAHRLEADAREVQRRLLDRSLPHLDAYDAGVAWSCAEHLGGDAYALSALPEGRLGVAIADGCGKGTAAALMMADAQARLEDLMAAGLPPGDLCARLGRALAPRVGSDRFVSLVYAVLDRAAGTLVYSNAGHPAPLLLRGRAVQRLDGGGPVLGLLDARYDQRAVPLQPADRLVLFTDGIVEASPDGPGGEEWGEARLIAYVQAMRGMPPTDAAASVLAEARAFAAGALADDATVVVVDVRPR